ncbi:MAG: hypothetical protein JJU28_03610 [Cyclobacteriaceae bacterium]|nr:hypothetical protein [Cyclobacteriaceae bacterium]
MDQAEAYLQSLLHPDIRKYITDHQNDDPFALSLRPEIRENPRLKEAISQIQSRQKAREKHPTWFQTEGIVWPAPVSVEQSSSEITARYKFSAYSGDIAIDLTGGMGVDAVCMAQNFQKAIYVEKDTRLCVIASHNFTCLGIDNIEVINQSAESFLQTYQGQANLMYIDPSRRSKEKGRVFLLSDCEPSLLQIGGLMRELSENLLVKLSPMLDMQQALLQMPEMQTVQLLGFKNELKEFLLSWQKGQSIDKRRVVCAAMDGLHTELFDYDTPEEDIEIQYGEPGKYLYEPNVAVMKAAPWKTLYRRFLINKMHPNTHLFSSDQPVEGFPGYTYKIRELIRPAQAKQQLKGTRFNIKCRNFKLKPEEVSKRYGISQGGNSFLFAVETLDNGHLFIICDKLD